ncbi:MAG: GPP34 family phosphoprotein [Dactylosporangium sp.]|nr:GPP34 family phosphoprotein [Dactylosporangium sp.]NNJ61695.1 GPP34 family phosphoprotein [Dactylosporangium sp.]
MTGFHGEAAAGGKHRPASTSSASDLEPGPLTLSGDLFLIMLDDATGWLRVRPRIAGYALAGAFLIELRGPGYISFDADRIRVHGNRAPTDPVLSRVWTRLVADSSGREIASWLGYCWPSTSQTTSPDSAARRSWTPAICWGSHRPESVSAPGTSTPTPGCAMASAITLDQAGTCWPTATSSTPTRPPSWTSSPRPSGMDPPPSGV